MEDYIKICLINLNKFSQTWETSCALLRMNKKKKSSYAITYSRVLISHMDDREAEPLVPAWVDFRDIMLKWYNLERDREMFHDTFSWETQK